MKKKGTTALLALLFGIFGVHRFYLGQRIKGMLHMGLFFFTLMAAIEANAPIVFIPAVLGFVDAILFFVMPKDEFDEKHNAKYLSKNLEPQPLVRSFSQRRNRTQPRQRVEVKSMDTFKESGMRKYDDFQTIAAIIEFRKALNNNFQDAQVHFLLANCYSMNEEVEKSLFHLDKAVNFGFIDFDTIHKAENLAYLRTDDRFHSFVKNSYQIPRSSGIAEKPATQNTPEPEEKLELKPKESLLDQIAALGELYEKGVLTPEEYQLQKERIMGS